MAKNKLTIHHEMKTVDPWFSNLERGTKTCELRLYDEKRQLFRLGDIIAFQKYPALEHECLMQITGLLHYPSFAQLIDDIDVDWLGYEGKSREWIKASMYDIYTPDEEKEFGVLGIRMTKVEK